ncbi:MAG: hypothetical protein EBS39_13540 [Gammaproteobacteria bacterium]|nr:hypothetical protein [Gammaproteobacteria bacterium]
MLFASTRGGSPQVGLAEALVKGLAPDGGLYVPTVWPEFRPQDFDGASSLAEVAERLLAPFAAGSALQGVLRAIVREARRRNLPVWAFLLSLEFHHDQA